MLQRVLVPARPGTSILIINYCLCKCVTQRTMSGALLLEASRNGNVDAARALLEAGADVDARNADGITALMMAAARGHVEVVHVLLEAGADVDARNAVGGDAADERGPSDAKRVCSDAERV